ncbi:MAG TPA: hypothetical protein PKH24_00505 [Sedimentisphaerales bacterium]|jgi:hypothetical protein|nr:hypothetical protein [Sedimentisphaerales bacterium]HNU27627.1 hypothetical protein [Sedimentisphaerales bacterium]
MRIPRHWTKGSYTGQDDKGKEVTYSAWGWSLDSLAAAKEDAIARAKRIFDHLVNGKQLDAYAYFDRPMREEIVQTLQHGGKEVAVVTRNRYGALVLNTASVLFVDVDYPRVKATGAWDAVLLVISRAHKQRRAAALQEATLEAVREWSQENPGQAFRVYRTRAGLRLLFVDKLYEPKSEETGRILTELGSDPLYRTLTLKQECFRARLTPKPWRCGSKGPPTTYPWKDPQAERVYRDWEQRYELASRRYRVCELVETCASVAADDAIGVVVELHDRLTGGDPGKELA